MYQAGSVIYKINYDKETLMPSYEVKNKVTGEVSDVFLRISDYDEYMKDNPDMERHYSKAPEILSGSNLSSGPKATGAFKEVISNIKSSHAINSIEL